MNMDTDSLVMCRVRNVMSMGNEQRVMKGSCTTVSVALVEVNNKNNPF